MEARARQYRSIKSTFAIITLKLLALGAAEYVHRHRHGIQSKTYEHPRFGESSIRYCAFNQYFDDREGRCMIIPGGGVAISIDESTTCSVEALRGHPHRSRNYYICRKSNTILAECGRGKRFENRLKRCTIDARPSIDEEDYDSHHHPYDHLHLPACQRSGRFPVPQDNCTSFYACTSNGFRFFRSIHKCPASTGFDPFHEICTTERACHDDELASTTVTDDRAEIFGSTIGLVVTTARPSLDEALLIHAPKENYSLNKSTTRLTAISASSSSSTSGYDEGKISVSFVPPDTLTTGKITTATSLPDSIDEVVGIVHATRPTTTVYEHWGETSPFASTTYVRSFGSPEQTDTSERSPVAVATNEIVDTSTANSAASDHESTVDTSGTIDGILYTKYTDDYVTLRSDNTARKEKKNESADTTVQISKNNHNDEFTDKTTVDDSGTKERDETRTSEANEVRIGLQVSYSTESAVDNASKKWLFDKNIEGATSTIADEISQREVTERELGTSLPVFSSSATGDAIRDILYKRVQSITTPSGISSIDRSSDFVEGLEIKSTPERITLFDAVTLTTAVDGYASSGEVSWKSLSGDGTGCISPTEIVGSTPITLTSLTPRNNEASIQGSNWTTEEKSTIADRYHGSFSTATPDDEKSTTPTTESAMSTTAYISEVSEKFDSTPVTFTSLRPRSNEATSIQDSNWTTEEESTNADRYHDTFSSISTDAPDIEKSTISGVESTMSTTEPTYITEVTKEFDLTAASLTSLTTETNKATSIEDSNWTTKEESTNVDRYHVAFSSFSTDTPDIEKSTISGVESVMSTTEPTYITEVTKEFDLTPASLTSLTTEINKATSIEDSNWTTKEESTNVDRYHVAFSSFSTDTPDNEKSATSGVESTMSTTEPTYITEVTKEFDLTPASLTSLTTETNKATSIEDSNWTTKEESTNADRYHVTFSSFSTDTPDNEKSATSGVESTMSTTEPTYITEVTKEFDLTPASLTSLTTETNKATSIEDSNWTTKEESTNVDRYHVAFSSFSTDTPDNEKSATSGVESTMSTTEPTYITEVTEEFDLTPASLTSLTTETNKATSIEDSNWTTKEESTNVDRYHVAFSSFSTDTPDNEKSATSGVESTMSTTEPTYITEVTKEFDLTPASLTSLTTETNKATSIEDSNWTTKEESTNVDRYHVAFSSFSTDTPDNEKSATSGVESTMSTTEPTYITEVTKEFDLTPASLTSLTTETNKATSIEDSNWTTKEESTIADRYHVTFSSFSTDTPDNEKSATSGVESTMSTTEPTYITEVTKEFDLTPASLTSLTTETNKATSIEDSNWTTKEESTNVDRYHVAFSSFSTDTPDNEKSATSGVESTMSTTEPTYITEVTKEFDLTPASLTSLTTETNKATSIEDSNWTTKEESTNVDRYHVAFSSFSTDTPDNEKSATSGVESTMSTTEPTYITEVTKEFDLTPASLTSLTTETNKATSIEDSNWTTKEESTNDRYHVTFSSFSTDTPDNEKSATSGVESTMSTTEPTYITEVTKEFDLTPASLTSLTTETNKATSIEDSNWTTKEESTNVDRYHVAFSSFSTDTPDNEKSATSGVESTMSTTEPTYITEVTKEFDLTPASLTSLTTETNKATSIEDSNWTTKEESTNADRYHVAFSSFSTDTPDNEKSATSGVESTMSTTEPTYITEVTKEFDLTPASLTSLTTETNKATSIEDSNWTTKEESTIADRYHVTFSSFSTDTPDNEKSATSGVESTMSTTEPTYITEVTKEFDLTPASLTSLTTETNKATSIEDSNWTTKEESTNVDRYHVAFSSFSTDTPDNEKSATSGVESTMSTTEPTYITEVTKEFDLTPASLTSLTTETNKATSIEDSNWTTKEESTIADRYHVTFSSFSTDTPDNEKSATSGVESTMSTTEPTYITEVTKEFDLTPASLTSLTTETNKATSIEDSNWTTKEESTNADRYHVTFSSFSTDTPDNEKSATSGVESTMSTTEPTYITEVTKEFDLTPASLTSLTTETNKATSIEDSNWTTKEESTNVDRYHVAFSSFSTDTPDNEKSATSGVESTMSTTEPTYITEVTKEFDLTPASLTSLTTETNKATSIEDSNWTTKEESTNVDRYHVAFSSFSTDTPDNEKSATSGVESTMSTTEPTYITEVTKEFDLTPASLTSLTTETNKATSIEDSNWTTKEESTNADRYHVAFSSFSTDTPDNEKSATSGVESTMSTTEPTYITEVTKEFDLTPASLTSLTTETNKATSIEDSNWTTKEESTNVDRYHVAFSSFSTVTPDNEKSATSGVESTMSTTEPTYITEVTKEFDLTPALLTSLTTETNKATSIEDSNWTTKEESTNADRYHVAFSSFSTDTPDNEKSATSGVKSATSTTEPTYITEVTKEFDLTPASLTSLTTETNKATSIEDSNWTTKEESTNVDRYHVAFSSFSTVTPDNEKSATSGVESTMSTTEPTYITEVTKEFDLTPALLTSLTTETNKATSIEDSNWTTKEESTNADRYHVAFSSFSTDTPDNEKSATSGVKSATSTTEPTYITEVTKEFDLTPASLTSLTTETNKATSIEDSNWTTKEESTNADRYHVTFSSFSTDRPDNEKSATSGVKSAMSTAGPIQTSEVTDKIGTYSGIVWKGSSTDDLLTSIEQHQSTTGENSYSPFTMASGMNIAISTTSITPSVSSEPSQLEDGPAQGSYTTFTSFFTDSLDNEKSTNAGTESAMSTAEPAHISEVTEMAPTHSKITWNSSWTDYLLTTIEQQQSTTGENLYPAFTYTSTFGASQFGTAQTKGGSNLEISVAVSTTSITPSPSSESSQFEDGLTRASYTSASNSSEYATTVEPSADSTNSLSTTMSSSSD